MVKKRLAYEMEKGITVNFSVLPEGCISNIISLTSPRDACRLSAVSSVFRSAVDSDSVWERFLPSDYQEILSRSVSPIAFSSKKDLYFYLTDHPIIIDGGNKSFALEKSSGSKCYMIAAKELSIVWGDTPRYWRFPVVAELLNVCWLEVHGKMDTRMLSPRTTYAAYIVLKFEEVRRGLDVNPAEVSVRFVGGGGGAVDEGIRNVYLDPEGNISNQTWTARDRLQELFHNLRQFMLTPSVVRPSVSLSRQNGLFPRERGDGWMEIEMGEFFNDWGEDGEVEMSLMEIKGGNWKSGLIIQGIELRPKQSSRMWQSC
ncbi:PREDICTED: F-box protein PP2-B10-like isoform X2 [Nelumbo nucifera]|uniref:F-box protein PP2-B10-like isoform X2 n=1 Tax=Nelumbo nucifera TaxID=4432 RepID=A0A1U8Q7S0_NELNU|nr:PREDICTED: F-box protein PP2-B10-like isoform X2 [Nelumbo nucifera]